MTTFVIILLGISYPRFEERDAVGERETDEKVDDCGGGWLNYEDGARCNVIFGERLD